MGALEDDAAALNSLRAEILRRLGEIRAYAKPNPMRFMDSRELLRKLNLTDAQIREVRRRLACR